MLECHGSRPGNTPCTALKPPCLASRNRLTTQNTTELSRATIAYTADVHRSVFTVVTTSGERQLACQRLVVQNVAEGLRPLTAQGRCTLISVIEPSVEIDRITIPTEVVPDGFASTPIPQTTATKAHIETSRGPRRLPKLWMLLHNSNEIEVGDIITVIDLGSKRRKTSFS